MLLYAPGLKVLADNSRNYAWGDVKFFGQVFLLYPLFYEESFDLSPSSGGMFFSGGIGGQNRPPFFGVGAKLVL